MSFYPRSGRRSGRGFMSGGWSQPSIFNMNPLDVISNLMSPVLDIMSPLDDIRDLMNQGARLYRNTPSIVPKVVQQKRRKTMQRGQLLPQKYRIVIDCTGIVDPNALKTNIKCVQDCKHLIVSSNLKKGRQFKRSYTLPPECDVKKMTKFVTPQGQLVIEFNYMDVPLSLAISPEHEICTTAEHGKCVHIKVPIADFVEPAKVKVHVKARDLFVHFEERIVPVGDWCSRVIYHTRVQLPQNVNLGAITAKCDKHKLTILVPIGVNKGGQQAISQQLHDIAVKRKLRHRKARAVSVGAEQKQQVPTPVTGEKKKEKKKQVLPSISGEKQKTPLETPTTKPTTPIGGQQEPTISKKKQKKQQTLLDKPEQKPSILKPEEKKTPSISEQKPTLEEKKPAQQLPVVSSEEKKKKKKKSKKLTATSTNMPTSTDIATPTSTATDVSSSTSTSADVSRKEPSAVNVGVGSPAYVGDVGAGGKSDVTGQEKEQSPMRTTEKGTDILKNIFESGGGGGSSQQQQGSQSTTSSSSSTEQIGASTQL